MADIEKLHDFRQKELKKWNEHSKSMNNCEFWIFDSSRQWTNLIIFNIICKDERMLVTIRKKRENIKRKMREDAVASDSSDDDNFDSKNNRQTYRINSYRDSSDDDDIQHEKYEEKLFKIQERLRELKHGSVKRFRFENIPNS